MSWQSGKSGGRSRGWSGAGSSRDRPTRRWQDASASSDGLRSRGQRRNRWVFTAVLALGLLGLFVWAMIPDPASQLIVLTATAYEPPFPINGWAEEDRGTLTGSRILNLLVMDESEQWNKDRAAKTEFDAVAIKEMQGRRKAPLIVYLSMHGVVNDDGKPCLLPPGAKVDDDKTWVPVGDVLSDIRQAVPAQRNILVALDCNRIRANWQLGILYNTFAERVEDLVEAMKDKLAGLAVITAAGPGQMSWASADLDGSAFARFLQLGLAGLADEGEDGNGDGDVSVHELARYLAREVSAWAQFNRGEPQLPVLLPKDAADFHLIRAVSSRKRHNLKDELSKQKRSGPPVAHEAIGALWSKLDTLRANDLLRFDPIACRDFEHKLLHLEELSSGGLAYHQQATDQLAVLDRELSKAVEQATAGNGQRRALADRLAISTDESWARIPRAAHTLPVAEYFGGCDAAQAQQIQELWSSLLEPGSDSAKSIIEASGQREPARKLAETQFLAALRQQNVRSLWSGRVWQKVLERRNRAERLATPRTGTGMPGDERAHYYARYVAERADQQRRLAEDLLFVGEQNGSKPYATHTAEADRLYQAASDVMLEASTAFGTLDLALAEAPYLAAWLCSPLAAATADRDERVNVEMMALVKEAKALNENVNRMKDPGGSSPGFRDRADRLAASLRKLNEPFDREVQRLFQGDAQGPAGWRAIEAALLVPLIQGETRASLLADRDKISTVLHDEYFDPGKVDRPADDAEAPSYLEAIGEWRFHPLLAILHPDEAQVETAEERQLEWCEKSATKVREVLRSRINASQFDEPAPSETANRELHERRKYSHAEHALRSIASLGYDAGNRTGEPIAELRRFDIQQLLIWHARRATEDFWTDVLNDDSQAGQPFFEQAANDFLQEAAKLRDETEPAIDDDIKRQHQALAGRLEARRARMQITPRSEVSIEPGAPVSVSLTVAASSPPSDYPRGIAAVFLREASQRLTGVQFEQAPRGKGGFVDLPFASGAAHEFKLALPGAAAANPSLSAVSYFRGAEYEKPFELSKHDGIRIDYEPHRYREQSITLLGDRRRQTSIVFILDCSWSMTEPSAGGIRMELAKNALDRMLREIAVRNLHGEGTRVGVWFFGHRVGWTNPPPGEPSVRVERTDWGEIRDDLSPSQDVEEIHELGVFDLTDDKNVRAELQRVQGWGRTPLYLALVRALNESEFDETNPLIVVITDGKNDQSEPPSKSSLLPTTEKSDLLAAWKRKPIPIHILGFNLAADEAQEARLEFRDIASKTGGSFHEVQTGGDLLAKLRDRLPVDRYYVRQGPPQSSGTAQPGDAIEALLSESVPITDVYPPPKEYTVSFRSANESVFLEGGEAIQLQVARKGTSQQIHAVPYDELVAAEPAYLVAGKGGRRTDSLLRIHKPSRDKTSVSFRLSLQRMPVDQHVFTPRPEETWLEVTPLAEDGSDHEPYVFYDRNFESQTPVPVLEWTALNWPDDADRARIRFWCRPNKTPGKTLYDVGNTGGKIGGAKLSMEGALESSQLRVEVVERHDPQSPVDALRIAFDSKSGIQPERVVHVFDRRNNLVTHSFSFSPEASKRLEPPVLSHFRVALAEEIKDGALQLPGEAGIEVAVDDAGEFLAPTVGAGDQ